MNGIEHKQALRRFHALCGELGITGDDKRAIVEGAGAESSADIPAWRLRAICDGLRRQANPRMGEMDKLRKRVMASVGGWLKAAGYASNADVIKAVACRASGYASFNKISAARLHNLYHNFRNKQLDKIAAESLMRDLVAHRIDLGGGRGYGKTMRRAGELTNLATVN
jgi:hypothetical protein